MCSNFALTITSQQAANEFGVLFSQDTEQQYFPYHPNKALDPPKAYSLPNVVYFDADGRRDVRQMRWGLLRSTSKTQFDLPMPFNARSDKRPTLYREVFKHRRCLVPASAFFDYSPAKTRFRFTIPRVPHFAFAGFYNVWKDDLYMVTFVTNEPSPWFAGYHDRQPVTLLKEQYEEWLDPRSTPERLHELLVPMDELEAKPEKKGS